MRAQGAPPGLTASVPQPSRQPHLINQQQQLHQVQEQAGETVVAYLSFVKQEKFRNDRPLLEIYEALLYNNVLHFVLWQTYSNLHQGYTVYEQ